MPFPRTRESQDYANKWHWENLLFRQEKVILRPMPLIIQKYNFLSNYIANCKQQTAASMKGKHMCSEDGLSKQDANPEVIRNRLTLYIKFKMQV